MNIPVKDILNEELKLLGFKKKGARWYRDNEDVISVVGLQKSQWGDQHYINLGIWVKLLGDVDFPEVKDCHIQCRLENVTIDQANDLAKALDEEDGWRMEAEERREIIKLGVGNADFLFFHELNTLEKIKKFISGNPKFNCAIVRRLVEQRL